MPRTVQDTNVSTRSARLKLKPRGKPHYRAIDHGLHIGYRRGIGGGRWVVRVYVGAQAYKVETIGTADDIADADGVAVLNWSQAQEKARQRRVELTRESEGLPSSTGPYTVADALNDYLGGHDRPADGASARNASRDADAFIIPKLGHLEVSKLTSAQVRKWHKAIAASPPRLRSKKGAAKVRYADVDMKDSETVRRRRSRANGILTILKAALNAAWEDEKVTSDGAWRRVKPFRGVDAARVRYLALPECTRLINASPEGFRELVQAALLTGCRYAELTRLVAEDFNADSGTVAILISKTHKVRHVVLTDEGVAFFKRRALGKARGALLLPRADGELWLKSHQARPMREACKAAKITPAISFHILRHTWASHSVMGGVPLLVVAKQLGHEDTRMVEKHYGHLAPSYIADEIRRAAPRFGIATDKRVVRMAKRARV